MMPQEVLNNGCVCSHGCESCDRLAEAFEAMREALLNVRSRAAIRSNPDFQQLMFTVHDALALADKVTNETV